MQKEYYKTHKSPVSSQVLTRAANRMMEDCRVIFGYTLDEVKTAAEKLSRGEKVAPVRIEKKGQQISNSSLGFREWDCFATNLSAEYYTKFADFRGETVYRVTWKFSADELYVKNINGSVCACKDVTTLKRWTYKRRGKYRYFCTHRPPTGGGVPSGYVSMEQYLPRSRYCGEVTYNEKPSDDELWQWGLELDANWEAERGLYMREEQ